MSNVNSSVYPEVEVLRPSSSSSHLRFAVRLFEKSTVFECIFSDLKKSLLNDSTPTLNKLVPYADMWTFTQNVERNVKDKHSHYNE